MIPTKHRHAVVSAAIVLVLLATGCARRPAITQAAAPPPTGAPVAVAPPPAPAPVVAPPAPAPAPAAPAPVEAARPAPKEFTPAPGLPDIHFDFDKFTIRADAAKILRSSAEWLKGNANQALLIEGHCDER